MKVDSRKMEEVFGEALAHASDADRCAYLDQACANNPVLRARIEALLAAHGTDWSFLKLPDTSDFTAHMAPVTEQPGATIGRFKLLEQIGEGGFGVVFMAEQQEPVRRRVALKVIKLGMDTGQVVARFEAERQALAMMDHPHVAKVLDGGVTPTGRPYFVMELVKGDPITEYCDKHRLSIPRRLELFTQVCAAIQHAHQKGLIHRDVKPSNILVSTQDDQPSAKVIDFGVAKAMQARLTERTLFTEFHQLVGTPEYMSPEQAEGTLDIDTRSDVYSLGVLLYELLVGSPPFDGKTLRAKAFAEMQRLICEVDPPTPSTRASAQKDSLPTIAASRSVEPRKLAAVVRGELDWIVMRCLEKDRARRYQTASALGDDLRRYLGDETLEARPASRAYRLKKYVRRNKAVVAFMALLAASVVALAGSNIAILHERDAKTAALALANQEQAKANEVSAFLRKILSEADPNRTNGPEYTVRDLLDESSRGLVNRFHDQPEIEAELRATIGAAYRHLELFAQAEPHLRRVVELRKQTVGSNHRLYADSLVALAWSRAVQGHISEAEPDVRRALVIYRAHADPDGCLSALRLWQWCDGSRSESVVEEALNLAGEIPGGENPDLASILHVYAESLAWTDRAAEGEALARKALVMHKRLRPAGHPEIAFATWTLGKTLEGQKKLVEAERAYREALEAFKVLYGNRPEMRGQNVAYDALIRVLKSQSKLEEATNLEIERDERDLVEIERAKQLAEEGNLTEAQAALRVVESRPNLSGNVRERLKEIYVEWKLWSMLSDALSRDLAESPDDLESKVTLALASLKGGQEVQYRKLCEELLDTLESQPFQPLNAGRVAQTVLLGNVGALDFKRACKLADRVADAEETKQFSSSSKALAELRRNQFASAQKWGADLAAKSEPQSERCSTGWLIQSLSYARLGQMNLAHGCLARSDEIARRIAASERPFNWRGCILNQVLRQEAEELLADDSLPARDALPGTAELGNPGETSDSSE